MSGASGIIEYDRKKSELTNAPHIESYSLYNSSKIQTHLQVVAALVHEHASRGATVVAAIEHTKWHSRSGADLGGGVLGKRGG